MTTTRLTLSLLLFATSLHAQHETRKQHAGNGPLGTPEPAFLVHRLGTDHAEGITTLDMNGDGFNDLVSGAYWYENPGAQGGDWKRHQWRTVGMTGEFVSDCGEWTIDVNHDGDLDLATAGKLGVHFLENLRINNVPAPTREAQQPSDRAWPFGGEGSMVKQENSPADLKDKQ